MNKTQQINTIGFMAALLTATFLPTIPATSKNISDQIAVVPMRKESSIFSNYSQSAYFELSSTSSVNRKLLFSCLTKSGKQILLYDSGQTIDYSFGKPGSKSELDLKVPRSEASTWQWKGIGRYENYIVDVPNRNTTYSVIWGVDHLSQNRKEDAGVDVFIDKKLASTVKCSSNIVNHMQGVNLKERK